ncbi:hypothetical protein Pan216_38740 [Planctomycetes bacterium Pan216]|uniref:Uncharacterized protein n=1 Tax=Kolteria novifilia TaxID=2527975 RepID=A0A518B7P8_9BACT|nr:hypothetical protein Pan216_38740 [Planctomycetes bacterium Pan216]
MESFDPVTRARIVWLQEVVTSGEADHLAPFRLDPHRLVTHPDRFCRSLLIDLASGPSGPRCRHGIAQEELKVLHERWPDRGWKAAA